MQQIGATVREVRVERGMTQDGLAVAAGVSRPTVARIETGYGVAMPSLQAVAKVLRLKVNVSVERTDA
ncbi:hypothetical protein BW730_14335 [Tessaracoccus aquimaris]|uniref:HTH cro/C1-type domain-containing protein n=2 Tax=Tessaracoccus aquimaris TaxID=1332264 RepID=A0A1Q2CTG2_9ACTN|nr:hypothetical protein BW730_14335 [Tessaracoccus aquimaris]